MDRPTRGVRSVRVQDLPEPVALNGHVVRDVEVKKGVTTDRAALIRDKSVQVSAYGGPIRMEVESGVRANR